MQRQLVQKNWNKLGKPMIGINQTWMKLGIILLKWVLFKLKLSLFQLVTHMTSQNALKKLRLLLHGNLMVIKENMIQTLTMEICRKKKTQEEVRNRKRLQDLMPKLVPHVMIMRIWWVEEKKKMVKREKKMAIKHQLVNQKQQRKQHLFNLLAIIWILITSNVSKKIWPYSFINWVAWPRSWSWRQERSISRRSCWLC